MPLGGLQIKIPGQVISEKTKGYSSARQSECTSFQEISEKQNATVRTAEPMYAISGNLKTAQFNRAAEQQIRRTAERTIN